MGEDGGAKDAGEGWERRAAVWRMRGMMCGYGGGWLEAGHLSSPLIAAIVTPAASYFFLLLLSES